MAEYGYNGLDMSQAQEPTDQSISELIYRARFEFNREDMRDRIRDSVYQGDNDISHPSHIDFQEVHMMVINNAVQNIIGLLANRPQVIVKENSLKTLKLTDAIGVQNFLNSLYPTLERDIKALTWLKILEDQTRFGRAYDALEYAPTRWAQEPRLSGFQNPDGSYRTDDFSMARKKWGIASRLPLIWRHLPARGCFAWKDDGGIYQFLTIEERAAQDIANSYNRPDLLNDLYDMARTPSMHVIFCRYWNRGYYAHWISKGYSSQTWEERAQAGLSLLTLADTHGEIIAKGKNPYGMVPVVETLSMSSTDQNPARMHLSPIDPIIPLATYLDELVSQKGSSIRVYCWPTPYLKNVQKELGAPLQAVPVGPDGRANPLNIKPGQILYLPTGTDISWLVVPQNGPDVDKQIAMVAAQCDKVIPSQLFDGSAKANGYLYNSMISAAVGKLAPMVMNTQMSHTERNGLAFRILEMHGDKLYNYQPGSNAADPGNWVEIGPKDVEDWQARYVISVDYQDEHPYDEAQDIAAAQQLTTPTVPGGDPLISQYTARAVYLHLPDPEKEAERIRLEKIQHSPMVEEMLQARASIDAGISLDSVMNEISKLTPEQIKMLPPSLVQAAAAMGTQIPGTTPPAGGAPGSAPPAGSPSLAGPPPGGGNIPGVSAPGGTPTAGGAIAGPQLGNAQPAASPSAIGGIPGAPGGLKIPGLTAPGTPPPPRLGTPPPRKG